jgi:photosystem II stability/assembly factor-like uncharacterized protein
MTDGNKQTLLRRPPSDDLDKGFRAALFALLLAAQVACAPIPTPRLTPSPSGSPTNTKSPVKTSTLTPMWSSTPTPTPRVTRATLSPSATQTLSLTPAFISLLPVAFESIQMMDMRTGWAVVDITSEEVTHIFRTVDGGAIWGDVSPVDADIRGAFFLDDELAWIWAQDQAWLTQDGGARWTPLGEFGWLPKLGFVDGQNGWKLNADYWGLSFVQFDILSFSITMDGGLTWQETNPPPDDWGVAFMAYPGAQMAWAIRAKLAKTIEGVPNVGTPFRIQATFDGGNSWITRQMPLPPDAETMERPGDGTYLSGVGNCEFVSPVYSSTAIWKLALTCELQSWMYTSANQGKTWIISDMPPGLDADIEFVDASTGWLLIGNPYESPEGHLYQTTDGGQSWTLIKRTGWADARLSFVNAQTGWAVACTDAFCHQPKAKQALIMTTDGGETWQILEPQIGP